jgi:hypothetical protein
VMREGGSWPLNHVLRFTFHALHPHQMGLQSRQSTRYVPGEI